MKNILLVLFGVTLALVGSVVVGMAKETPEKSYNLARALEEMDKGNMDGAFEYYQKELMEHPKSGYAYLGLATIHFDKRDYDEAIEEVDLAIKLLPKKEKTLRAAAFLLRGQGMLVAQDTVSAFSDMAKAIETDPGFADAYEARGELFFDQHRYEESSKDFGQLVKLNPGNVMGHMGLGRVAHSQGQFDDAIAHFDKVVQMYPDYSSGYAFRAKSYMAKDNYLKAADDICRALEIDSDDMASQLMYKFPKDQVELLVAKLKGLSAKHPFSGEYMYCAGLLYAYHKMYEKSNEVLKNGYDIDAHGCFIKRLAENAQDTGDYMVALEYVSQAQQMNPDDMDLIALKADILGESGNLEGAIAELSRYIDKTPDFFGGYYRRGWFKDVAMKTDEAIEDYKMAAMLQPDHAYSHLGLADMLMRKGEIDQANEEYRKVIELDSIPDNESCAMYALLALDRKEDAISFMNKVIENDPEDAGNSYDAACFYSRIGDRKVALKHLETALDKGFKRFYHLRHDDDLEELRKMPEFEEMMAKYETTQALNLDSKKSEGKDLTGADTETVEIPFTSDEGCLSVKCTINELPLNFIFDTGASIVSLSQLEANFMLKNGYLKPSDFVGRGRFIDANGDISEGTMVNLRNVDFAGMHLKNVQANVVRNQKAPLLLGQSVLGRLGKIEIDNSNKKLIITKRL